MSDCKWEVGKTYRTTLPGVTATITDIEGDDVIGDVSNRMCRAWRWCKVDGKFRMFENSQEHPHLTTELADEPQVEPVKPQPVDVINAPPHYNQGDIECIDAIQAALSPEEFRGHLRACALKYLWRCNHKGGREDLLKAEWYLKRLNREMIRGECASHGIKGCEKEGGEA